MKINDRFSSYNDLKTFVRHRLPDDLSCYGISEIDIKNYNNEENMEHYLNLEENLVEKAVDNFLQLLKNEKSIEFLYGKFLCNDWFDRLFPNGNEDWFKIFD